MKWLKNILVGFIVSFVGSLPLGFLNVVGFHVFQDSGMTSTIWYLLGVVSIEVFVIYLTLVFAKRLMENQKLIRFIEGFSAVFMLALAVWFYLNAIRQPSAERTFWHYDVDSSYLLGLGLSSLNVIQVPFWTGWNLYLLNNSHIDSSGAKKYSYIFGTATGTFFGMLAFIVSVKKLETTFFPGVLHWVIILTFGIMGILQTAKYIRKYHVPEK